MRKLAQLTCLILGAAALAGIAGLATAAVIDAGSAVVVAVVVALGILVIGLLEWTHRRRNGFDSALLRAEGLAQPWAGGTPTYRTPMLPGFLGRPGEFAGRF
jgi:hypothetical protein